MKKTFLLVPLAIILVMSLFLVSCEDEPEIKTYTVTFLLDESDTEPFDKKTVLEGAGITDAKVPEKTDHKFLYWKTAGGNEAYELKTPVKGDLTLVAAWEINKYTVSFMDGEEKAAEPQTVEYGKKAKAPTAPTKEGHTFSCWKKVGSSSPFDFETEVIAEDTVLEAVWDINNYTVTFDYPEGQEDVEKKVLHGENVESPEDPNPSDEKYEFLHWTADAKSKEEFKFDTTPIEDNLTLYPVFGIKEFTVTFVGAEGLSSVPEQQIVEYGNKAEDPKAIVKDGYVFKGWKIAKSSESYFDFDKTQITSSITLYALCQDTTKAHVSFFDGEKLVASGYYKIENIQEFPIYNNVGTGCKLTKWVLESNPEKEYLPGGGFTPVDYKTEYKFYAYITTDLLTIDKNGSVKATNTLKDSSITSLSIPYSLNGIAVRTIGGSGFSDCKKLVGITIPDSVTHIQYNAFLGCSNLTSITIPDSVTNIEEKAFVGCSNLESVNIPNGVKWIKEGTFAGCNKLTSITIPVTVTSIGKEAFKNCSSLTSITIPASVTSIGSYVFYGCTSLTEINVSVENTNYKSVGGVLFDKATTKLMCYPAAKTDYTYTVPSTVKTIEGRAFADCINLETVKLEGVTSIGFGAFEDCSALTSIDISTNCESIGNYAFQGCKELTSIKIPASCKTIGMYAFSGCESLGAVDIAEGCETIGDDAFKGCKKLESIVIPSSVESFGEWVFGQCTKLTSAVIQAKVSTIDINTFNGCDALQTISLSSSISSLPDNTFGNLKALQSISVPDENMSLKSVDGVLYDKNTTRLICFPANKNVTTYTVPETVTEIGAYAFRNNQKLTSVIIPESVKSIGVQAFYSCTKLSDVYIKQTESELFKDSYISSKVTKHWNSTGPAQVN